VSLMVRVTNSQQCNECYSARQGDSKRKRMKDSSRNYRPAGPWRIGQVLPSCLATQNRFRKWLLKRLVKGIVRARQSVTNFAKVFWYRRLDSNQRLPLRNQIHEPRFQTARRRTNWAGITGRALIRHDRRVSRWCGDDESGPEPTHRGLCR
jgi:hypothetical protein